MENDLTTASDRREWRLQWVWDSLVLAVVIATIGPLELYVARLGGAYDPVFVDWLVLPWIPSGIAVGALMLRGASRWPGIFVGEAAYTAIVGAAPPVVVLGATVGTLGALAAYALLRLWRCNPSIERWRDPLLLWVAAAIGGLCISGAYAVGFLVTAWLDPVHLRPVYAEITLNASGHVALSYPLLQLAIRWWVNVTAGTALVVPCLYAFTPPGRRRISGRLPELSAILVLLLAWVFAAYAPLPWTARLPLALSGLLLVTWSAIRFGAGLTSFVTITLALTTSAIYLLGRGALQARPDDALANAWAFIVLIAVLGQMITALLAERAASEARYRALFDSNPQPLWVQDPTTLRILMANDAAVRHYGYTREEFTGLLATDLVAHDQPDNNDRTLSDTNEHLHRTRDGTLITVELRSHPIEFDGEEAELTFSYDVTDRNRLRSALINATDRAARKLGQELHDGLGQELVGLSLITRSESARVERGDAPDADVLGMIDHIAQRAVLACRNISHGLSALTETGGDLAGALEKLSARFAAESGPAISVAARSEVELVLPDAALDHIYRIAQEALTNALKHARARHVGIQFAVSKTRFVLTVRDDGVGLPRNAARGLGLGLSSMRYRAAAIGARLFVTSPPEGGTEVRLECPQGAAADATPGRNLPIAAQRTA